MLPRAIGAAFVAFGLLAPSGLMGRTVDFCHHLPLTRSASAWLDRTGNKEWPPHDGFESSPSVTILPTGSHIDRYGCSTGEFFSPMGTLYEDRSLPFDKRSEPYTVYVVLKPLEAR